MTTAKAAANAARAARHAAWVLKAQIRTDFELGVDDATNATNHGVTVADVVEITADLRCSTPGCDADMREMKCPNDRSSCLDHCGEREH